MIAARILRAPNACKVAPVRVPIALPVPGKGVCLTATTCEKKGGEKEPPLAYCFDVFLPIPARRIVEDSSQSDQRDGTLSAESVRDGAIRSGVEGGSHLRTLCVPSLAFSLFLVAKHSQHTVTVSRQGCSLFTNPPAFKCSLLNGCVFPLFCFRATEHSTSFTRDAR